MDNLKNIMSNLFNKKFTDDTITKISNILQEFADNNQIPQDQKDILKNVDFNKFMIDMIDKDMIYENMIYKDKIDKNNIDSIKEGAQTWASLFNDVYNNDPKLGAINGMDAFMTKIKNLIPKTVGGKNTKKRKGKVGGKSKKKRGSRKK